MSCVMKRSHLYAEFLEPPFRTFNALVRFKENGIDNLHLFRVDRDLVRRKRFALFCLVQTCRWLIILMTAGNGELSRTTYLSRRAFGSEVFAALSALAALYSVPSTVTVLQQKESTDHLRTKPFYLPLL